MLKSTVSTRQSDEALYSYFQYQEWDVMASSTTEYGRRLQAIHERIEERVGAKPVVFYSAYETDADGYPIDNLDEVAIRGRVRFRADHDPYWGSGRDYVSPFVDSPTWLDVAVLANTMILTTGDRHHCFLERVRIVMECNGFKLARFSMGS